MTADNPFMHFTGYVDGQPVTSSSLLLAGGIAGIAAAVVVGGMFGIIMLAVLGHASWVSQLGGLAVVGIWTLVVTVAIVLVVKALVPIRATEEDETIGLDLSAHGERAYVMSS